MPTKQDGLWLVNICTILLGGGMCNVMSTLRPMENVLPKYISMTDCPVVSIDP